MLKKKIILVIFVITALVFSVFPVSAYYVGEIRLAAQFSTLRLSGTSSSSKIDLIMELPDVADYDLKSNESVLFEFVPNSPHIGIIAGVLNIAFPEAKYVQGQSYNFSFKLNGAQSNNNTAAVIVPSDFFEVVFAKFAMFDSWYSLGDTVPSWSNYYEKAFGTNLLNYTPIAAESQQLWNNSKLSFDFNLPSDYHEGPNNNTLTIFIIMRSNYINEQVTLSNFSLTPTGATKQLYAQQEHNLLVEEKLSDIEEGIDEGFSNINGELEEGFSNVSGELEEGFSNLLEQPEQEKQEAGQTGNNALDSILGNVDDKGPGVIEAFSSLVTALSYTGTEAKWQVPPIKLPAIDGLWDEIVLTDNVEIDFNYWIDKLPPTIITLSQALTTIAFIIYCFKELYDIISYVLTLRRS